LGKEVRLENGEEFSAYQLVTRFLGEELVRNEPRWF
jgi:hypothetical protein